MRITSHQANPFRLDCRSLALFRILIAMVVIIDLGTRLSLAQEFLGSAGLPNPADPTLFPPWLWSVHRLHGGIPTAITLLLVQMAVAAAQPGKPIQTLQRNRACLPHSRCATA
jgi:hypothetical protein